MSWWAGSREGAQASRNHETNGIAHERVLGGELLAVLGYLLVFCHIVYDSRVHLEVPLLHAKFIGRHSIIAILVGEFDACKRKSANLSPLSLLTHFLKRLGVHGLYIL